jgi:hypothetical protein
MRSSHAPTLSCLAVQNTLACEASGNDRVLAIAENPNEFGRQYSPQNIDGFRDIANIGLGHGAPFDVLPRAIPQGPDVRQQRFGGDMAGPKKLGFQACAAPLNSL